MKLTTEIIERIRKSLAAYDHTGRLYVEQVFKYVHNVSAEGEVSPFVEGNISGNVHGDHFREGAVVLELRVYQSYGRHVYETVYVSLTASGSEVLYVGEYEEAARTACTEWARFKRIFRRARRECTLDADAHIRTVCDWLQEEKLDLLDCDDERRYGAKPRPLCERLRELLELGITEESTL